MTQEEKARAYDEALKQAKFYHGNCPSEPERKKLEKMFPVLHESEDEKIRKSLIDNFKHYSCTSDGTPSYKILAWLEKQKEQIPYTDFVIKPHKGDDNNPYDMPVSEAQEYAINRGFGIPFNDGEVYVDERHLTQTIGNILRWADEHPKEQKPAEWSDYKDKVNVPYCSSEPEWSEEDRHAIENCEYAIKETFKDEQNPHRIGTLDWLKSLRPQPKAELTLLDENIIKAAVAFVEQNNHFNYWGGIDKRTVIKALRSLKPHWKPSEEQIKAIRLAKSFVTDDFDEHPTLSEILMELEEQLKKLM